jgi:hypothetical protein
MNHLDHFHELKDKGAGYVLTLRDCEILKTVWHELAGYKAAYDLETRQLPFEDCKNKPGVRAAKATASRRLFGHTEILGHCTACGSPIQTNGCINPCCDGVSPTVDYAVSPSSITSIR